MLKGERMMSASTLVTALAKRFGGGMLHYDDLMAAIADVPSVNACEVVHARWEDMFSGKYANPRYRCSACKKKALFKSERDLLDNWRDVQALTKRCHNCGAEMENCKYE